MTPAEIIQQLAEVGDAILAQNNRMTGAPIFVVERKVRTTGFDPAYADDHQIVWLDCEGYEADEEEHVKLEQHYFETLDEPEDWARTAFQDDWVPIVDSACFTKKGCEDYLRINGHNIRGETRIFANGSFRNEEFQKVRELCVAAAKLRQQGEA